MSGPSEEHRLPNGLHTFNLDSGLERKGQRGQIEKRCSLKYKRIRNPYIFPYLSIFPIKASLLPFKMVTNINSCRVASSLSDRAFLEEGTKIGVKPK